MFLSGQVSVVVKSDHPEDVGRNLLSAWNDPSSRLHVGAVTGLIDFAQVRYQCSTHLCMPLSYVRWVGGGDRKCFDTTLCVTNFMQALRIHS